MVAPLRLGNECDMDNPATPLNHDGVTDGIRYTMAAQNGDPVI